MDLPYVISQIIFDYAYIKCYTCYKHMCMYNICIACNNKICNKCINDNICLDCITIYKK